MKARDAALLLAESRWFQLCLEEDQEGEVYLRFDRVQKLKQFLERVETVSSVELGDMEFEGGKDE